MSVVIRASTPSTTCPRRSRRCSRDHRDLEVVLVDDGGTDDLAGWVRDRAEPRATHPPGQRRTVRGTQHRIAASDGELVAFLDSDDTWEPDYLSRMVGCFDDPAVGLACSGWDVVDAAGGPTGEPRCPEWSGDVWDRFVTRNPVACSGAVVRRTVFDDVGSVRGEPRPVPDRRRGLGDVVRIAASHQVAVAGSWSTIVVLNQLVVGSRVASRGLRPASPRHRVRWPAAGSARRFDRSRPPAPRSCWAGTAWPTAGTRDVPWPTGARPPATPRCVGRRTGGDWNCGVRC